MYQLKTLFILVLLVIVPSGYSELILDNSLLPKFLGLAITLIFGLLLFQRNVKEQREQVSWLDISLICFVFIQALSIFQAINKPDAIYESLKLFLLVSTFFLIKLALKENKEKVYQAIAIGAFLATLIALFTCVEELFAAFRMRVPYSAATYTIKGIFGHKNMLSNWFLFLIPLNAIGLFLNNKTPKVLFKLGLAIQLLMIALLLTRAAYTGLIISALFAFMLYKYRTKRLKKILPIVSYSAISLVLFAVVLTFFNSFPTIIELDSSKSSSVIERIVVWKKTIGMIKDHFWFGVGAGNWKIWLPNQELEGLRRTLDGSVVFSRPHNDFLWIWAEQGILGISAFISILFFSIKSAWNQLFEKETLNKPLLFAFSGLVAYLLIASLDFPKERIEANIVLAFFLAIISVEASTNLKEISLNIRRSIPSLLAIPILLFACYFSWTRMESETYTRKALEAKDKGDQNGLVNNTLKAQNRFFLADNNGIPICWYSGIALFNLNQKEEAALNFKKAFELNPFNFNVTNNVGTAYFIEGNYIEAEKHYLETLRINPSFDDTKLNLAAVYVNTNQKEKAKLWLNKVNSNSKRVQELRALAQ